MYCEKSDVERFLGITIADSLDFFIKSAMQIIDKETGRTFTANKKIAVAEERKYNGSNNDELYIDDFFEVEKLEVGNDLYGKNLTEYDEDDFILFPLNADKKGQPFNTIKLKYGVFPYGIANQIVTAKFGYGTLPDDIKFACITLAGGMYSYSQGGDEIKSESIGAYSVSYGGDVDSWTDLKKVKEILYRYKKYTL